MGENLIAKSTLNINAPASKVWDALINPVMIKQYLFGSDVISDWREGSPVIYKGNYLGKEFEDKGKVLRMDPEKLLVMTHWSPLSGTPDLPENYHTVAYELTTIPNAIQVTISQDNNASEEERLQSEKFWTTVLEGMKKLLEN